MEALEEGGTNALEETLLATFAAAQAVEGTTVEDLLSVQNKSRASNGSPFFQFLSKPFELIEEDQCEYTDRGYCFCRRYCK